MNSSKNEIPLKNVWLEKKRISELTSVVDKEAEMLLTMKWGTEIPEEVQGEKRNALAIILENQSLWNKSVNCNRSEMYSWINPYSEEILKRAWLQSHLFDWVSVQPLLGPAGRVVFKQNGQYDAQDVASKTKKMKVCLSLEQFQDLRSAYNLCDEDKIDYFVYEFMNELHIEVLTDLRNKADTYRLPCRAHLDENVVYVASYMMDKISLHGIKHPYPNWLVTSPEMVEGRYTQSFEKSLFIIKTDLKIAGMQVYVDPLYPKNEFLIGAKGDRFEAGYFYSPYIGLDCMPVVLDPDTFCPRTSLMTRYAKRLLNRGGVFYGRGIIA